MDIDYSSKLLLVPTATDVYSYVSDIAESEYESDFYKALDSLGLSAASPWFDADAECLTIGVEIPSPTYEDLLDQESKWWGELNKAKDLLFEIFGSDGVKLNAYQHIY